MPRKLRILVVALLLLVVVPIVWPIFFTAVASQWAHQVAARAETDSAAVRDELLCQTAWLQNDNDYSPNRIKKASGVTP